jgi:chromatin segregation and condensation protein Rec8/ScpA/Scc1 (kleisin family)
MEQEQEQQQGFEKRTPEELRAEYIAWKQQLLRVKSNNLLQKSDKYHLSDFPIDKADRDKITEWRAGLYQMEHSDSFINDGEFDFPEKPEVEVKNE